MKYILIFLTILISLNFVIAGTCPTGVYPCNPNVQFNNPQTSTGTSNTNYSLVNVNNSLFWQGHTGTDGSWLTNICLTNGTSCPSFTFGGGDLDLGGGTLYTIPTTYLSTTSLYLDNIGVYLSIDPNAIRDTSTNMILSPQYRTFYASDGITPMINFNNAGFVEFYDNDLSAPNICYSNGTNCALSGGDFYYNNFSSSFNLNNTANWNRTQTYNKTEIDNNFSKVVKNYTNIALTNQTNIFNNNQTINGNLNFTGNRTISTNASSITITQTGDTYGDSSLSLQSRHGSAGALFSSTTLDMVDFGFNGSTGNQNNLRMEHRTAGLVNANNIGGEFQFIDPAYTYTWFSSGRNGTTISSGNLSLTLGNIKMPNGRIGIETSGTESPITLGAGVGKKISLYEGINMGFGVNGGEMSLFLGDTGRSFAFYGGDNLVSEVLRVYGTGLLYASTNVSATGFITRTSVYDKTQGNALDKIKDANNYKTGSEINHSAFYGYTNVKVTDFSKPIIKDVIKEVCYKQNSTDKETCINQTIKETTYPYTKDEAGVDLGKEIDVLRQAVYELKIKNQELEARITALEKK